MGLWDLLFGRSSRRGVVLGDGGYGFRVVGTLRHQDILEKLAGGRRHEGVHCHCEAMLVPEPSNPYDRHAVAIRIRGIQVGYLDRPDAPDFLKVLDDAGCADATCDAQIVGGWDRGDDQGFFGVRLNAVLPFKIAYSP